MAIVGPLAIGVAPGRAGAPRGPARFPPPAPVERGGTPDPSAAGTGAKAGARPPSGEALARAGARDHVDGATTSAAPARAAITWARAAAASPGTAQEGRPLVFTDIPQTYRV
ncbi:MAG: hypothetical protein E6G27_15495 [Actinobacteria bacterium]|nr:MAG: hypothetical protein E6G27_15495 [Actinomycetota bacterium]